MVYIINIKTLLQTKQFAKWFRRLKDDLAKVAIGRRLERLVQENYGDFKSIGEKIFELRINISKGYRVYFMDKENEIIILLLGGDKSSQDDDIKMARRLAKEYKDGKSN